MKKISVAVLALLVLAGVAFADGVVRDPAPGVYDWVAVDGTMGGTMEVLEDPDRVIIRDGEGEIIFDFRKAWPGQEEHTGEGYGTEPKVGARILVLLFKFFPEHPDRFDEDGSEYGKPDGVGEISVGDTSILMYIDRHPH